MYNFILINRINKLNRKLEINSSEMHMHIYVGKAWGTTYFGTTYDRVTVTFDLFATRA